MLRRSTRLIPSSHRCKITHQSPRRRMSKMLLLIRRKKRESRNESTTLSIFSSMLSQTFRRRKEADSVSCSHIVRKVPTNRTQLLRNYTPNDLFSRGRSTLKKRPSTQSGLKRTLLGVIPDDLGDVLDEQRQEVVLRRYLI